MSATPRRGALLLIGSALVLVLMTVAGLLLVTSSGSTDRGARADGASDSATDGATDGAGDGATGTASPTGSATDDVTGEPTDQPASGPGYTEPGIDLRVMVTADGDFDVHETVLMNRPADLVRLDAPALASASTALEGLAPEATTVQMSADDDVVALEPDSVTDMRAVELPAPATGYALHYRLEGATAFSSNSTPGRALGAVAPLSRGLAPDLPVRITLADDAVLNVTCPMLRGAEQLCSSAGPDGSYVVDGLTVMRSVALVQIELG